MEKMISFEEVDARLTIRKTRNGKALGPDGIPNEFWKLETEWRDRMKKEIKQDPNTGERENEPARPCIAAIYNDKGLRGH